MITSEAIAFLRQVREIEGFDGSADLSEINIENRVGENALHYAVIWGDLHAAKALIDSGIDIDKRGEDLYTPLHEAVERRNLEMVEILLNAGARTDLENQLGDSPRDMAAAYKFPEIVSMLDLAR